MLAVKLPSPQDILFLRGDINYTEFHLVNGKKVVSSTTLLRHQEKLDGFLRVSRKYLVTPEYITATRKEQNVRYVVLLGGQELRVSRRRTNNIQ
ncbi:LytTR family DNA-binding domain-containing protein [Lacihabitans sp. CS3-21]|uniref:LytTR family DNA-binding domain-containing protein n=1 Tax=Lacihabitans sp. CS3-21 TaxID=2487332 RepID=UPI0020CFE2BA|nr:LytTR family DNA-binding domain-containing protein [Lacihabitans sp. CS3-21]MCP9748605.1 LytTR family transcriptional regulator [Lacihabitans sp. CS3-21]